MGDILCSHDWASTELSPVESWPPALADAVSLIRSSRSPMIVLWGSKLILIYNDVCALLFGSKHPQILGKSGSCKGGALGRM